MPISAQLLDTYSLARQSLADGDVRKAGDLCRHILDADPDCAHGYHLMSRLFKSTGNLDKALMFADLAVQREPEVAEFYVWTAELCFYLKNFARAESMARLALMKKPDDEDALGQLFASLREQQKFDESQKVLLEILKLQPETPQLKHAKLVLGGETIESAPKAFVETLFDGYSTFFDRHLQENLSYRIPFVIAGLLRGLPQLAGKSGLSMLDLGCGTGLAAEALREMTARRVGVDLSQNMLDQAKSKQLYDALHKCDIMEFLASDDRSYDVITAADVLIYISDIQPLFEAVRRKLTPHGLFVFSIEKEEGPQPSRINAAGRYCQSVPYILALAKQCGYDTLVRHDCVVRTEKTLPVAGMVFILAPAPQQAGA